MSLQFSLPYSEENLTEITKTDLTKKLDAREINMTTGLEGCEGCANNLQALIQHAGRELLKNRGEVIFLGNKLQQLELEQKLTEEKLKDISNNRLFPPPLTRLVKLNVELIIKYRRLSDLVEDVKQFDPDFRLVDGDENGFPPPKLCNKENVELDVLEKYFNLNPLEVEEKFNQLKEILDSSEKKIGFVCQKLEEHKNIKRERKELMEREKKDERKKLWDYKKKKKKKKKKKRTLR
eukprot:TRINITY_DN5737_c0_g1_i8.p1 TRINITY_DN5737_c0_g1~~TRINITY_DN5737_c0_g1_i8.p1  ORF type:complete len:263 (-),score=91.16 TRINITY_DN5737_c0_g1_i8:68-775(-)